MADEKAQTVAGEEEPKIPVLTVLKNGAILKNIFIVNKPPPPPHSQAIASEEILMVGRHPDCHIVLTHPSVSRFHLQILSNPSSHKLSLTDLSSVHGTWISDKRIEPGVRVELRQGDTLRVGASSRLYRLHWIPLSHAYQDSLRVLNCSDGDFEAMESLFSDEPQGGDQSVDNSSKHNTHQVVNMLPIENAEFESTESISEFTESLVCDDNLGFIGRKEIPLAPPMLEEEDLCEHGGQNSSKVVGQENKLSTFWAFGTESVNLFYPVEDSTSNSEEHQYLQLNCVTGVSELDKIPESSSSHEKGEASPIVQVLEKDQGQSDISALLSAGPFVRENSSLLETKYQQVEEDSMSLETNSDLLVNLDGKSSTTKDHGQTDQLCLSSEPLQYFDEKEEDACPAAQISGRTDGQSSLSKDHGQTDIDFCLSYGPSVMENSSLLVGEVLGEINNQPDEEENTAHKPTLLVNLDPENTNEIRCLVDERCAETEKRSVSPKNHHEERDIKTISSVPPVEDSTDSFSPDGVLSEIIDDKENQTLLSICIVGGQPDSEFCKSPPLISEDKSIFGEKNLGKKR